jgi:hypothetical protein
MDLNPVFTSAASFRPAGDGGALKLFRQTGIQLVHGWLVDPASPEYAAVAAQRDYDSCVNLIAEADSLAQGRLVTSAGAPDAGPSSATVRSWTAEEQRKVENGAQNGLS